MDNSMKKGLTKGKIYKLKDIPQDSYFGKFLSHFQDLEQFSYVLAIQSLSSKCMKLSLYPLKDKKVSKLILYGKNTSYSDEDISEADISHLIKLLNEFKIIHTSGLLMKKGRPLFECYLNINLSDTDNSIIQNITQFVNTLNLKLNIEKIKLNQGGN
jgi:hypothetical protein